MYTCKCPTIRSRLRHIKNIIYDDTIMYLRSQLATHENRFMCGGVTYDYARFRANSAYSSERVIELPIVFSELDDKRGGKVLEVGNVLNHYCYTGHDVVDKYEIAKNVTNCDIVDFVPSVPYDLIISISTIEHVGYDEEIKSVEKPLVAINKLLGMLNVGGALVITIPLGYNPSLDEYIQNGALKADRVNLLHRVSCENEWVEESIRLLKTKTFKYNDPYPYANWVLVMKWCK